MHHIAGFKSFDSNVNSDNSNSPFSTIILKMEQGLIRMRHSLWVVIEQHQVVVVVLLICAVEGRRVIYWEFINCILELILNNHALSPRFLSRYH